ncbi:MAG: hypothetical protein JXA25_16265 [Anaerolineales bacterium]|nr:hypothetical protein [Anaerolineales bacterium]
MDPFEFGITNDEGQSDGGIRMAATTPEPPFDPDEPWSELPRLKKVSPAAVFDLVEELRQAGIPARSPAVRSSGLFSGKVNVTISVPDRLLSEAAAIVTGFFSSP